MGEALRMSGKERDRLVELEQVAGGKQTLQTAADRLRLSYRREGLSACRNIWRSTTRSIRCRTLCSQG